MKVKSWHIGCLVVLIAAALYFLVGTREGLDNRALPPSLPTPDLNGTWQVNGQSYTGKITQTADTWTLTPSSTESGWTSVRGNFAPGSSTTGSLIYITPGGELRMTFTVDSAGTTITGSNGGSFSKMPDTPPMSAASPAAPMASMTPAVPAPLPTPSTASAPSYSLTCTASPVSGMVGSAAAMPETPAAWNVQQPPSGWNSKDGYTTGGLRN